MADPRTTQEPRRLELLNLLGLPHVAPDPDLDRLARLAAAASGWPIALVTFHDSDSAWIAARVGFEAARLSLADTFCARLQEDSRPLEVTDATSDARFAGIALVAGP